MQEFEKNQLLDVAQREEVICALETILATEKFDAAPQMSAFLRYVVEQAVAGNHSRIKAFTVAVDALGKPETFDPQNDPVVRVLAGRLRAALAAYNVENLDADIVISMSPGSYVPKFTRQSGSNLNAVKAEHTAEKADSTVTDSRNGAPLAESHSDQIPSATTDYASQTNDASGHVTSTLESPVDISHSDDGGINPDSFPRKGYFGQLTSLWKYVAENVSRSPGLALGTVLLSGLALGVAINNKNGSIEPPMAAANPTQSDNADGYIRAKPELPCVFISAIDRGNTLENSLLALVSGVMSESESVRVYRILDTKQDIRFWPEDYTLTLFFSHASEKTLVSMHLMEARTGRVVHSETVKLSEKASTQLTQAEISSLIATSRSIVGLDGPLLEDYGLRVSNND